MAFRGPESMKKVDELSFMLIDIYISALTQRLNSVENPLQLSQNKTLFAVCHLVKRLR
jgi:hypothetical protein